MQEKTKYLIIGGGVASAHAAVAIREKDKEGRVLIVCGEDHFPYDHPPLSKNFLQKDSMTAEDPESKDQSWYTDNNVDVKKNTWITAVNAAAKAVASSDGEIGYDKLIIATGAQPKKPKFKGADLPNVHSLRTVDDAEAIRSLLRTAKSVLLVGGSYIGLEVAASAIKRGVKPIIVEMNSEPWSRFKSPLISGYTRKKFEEQGVEFSFEDEVIVVAQEGSQLRATTKKGLSFVTDFVVVGIGIDLHNELPNSAGLKMAEDGGVVVDEYLRTSDPDIYAAGDIASFEDIVSKSRWRAEHHLNAKWQGRQAGLNATGAHEPFDKVAYFFSDVLDLHAIIRGNPGIGKSKKALGDFEAGEIIELFGNDQNVLTSAVAISHDEPKLDEISDILEKLIREGSSVDGIDESTFGMELTGV